MDLRRSSATATSAALLLAGLALAIPACGSTPPSRFYVLAPLALPAADAPAAALALALEPVALPALLDRAQIVTRTSEHQRHVAELHRWAEPLDGALTRVLAENLARALGSERVAIVPDEASRGASARVAVNVLRLDLVPAQGCQLEVRWRLYGADGALFATQHATFGTATTVAGYDALAQAASQAVADLAGAIAETIRAHFRSPRS